MKEPTENSITLTASGAKNQIVTHNNFQAVSQCSNNAFDHKILPYPKKLIRIGIAPINSYRLLGSFIAFMTYIKANGVFNIINSLPRRFKNGVEYQAGCKYFNMKLDDLTKDRLYIQLHLLPTARLLKGHTLYFFIGYYHHLFLKLDEYFNHSTCTGNIPDIEMQLLKNARITSQKQSSKPSLMELLGRAGSSMHFNIFENPEYTKGQQEGEALVNYLQSIVDYTAKRFIKRHPLQHTEGNVHLSVPCYSQTRNTPKVQGFANSDRNPEDSTPTTESFSEAEEPISCEDIFGNNKNFISLTPGRDMQSACLPPPSLQPCWENPFLNSRPGTSIAPMSLMFSPPKTNSSTLPGESTTELETNRRQRP